MNDTLETVVPGRRKPLAPDDPTVRVAAYKEPPPPPRRPARWRQWLRNLVVFGFVAGLLGSMAGVVGIMVLARDLPTIQTLNDYRPPQVTSVYGTGGGLVARFAAERRTLVPYEAIPKVMLDAVIAAEDSGFFEHQGLDYVGIVRCAVKNLLSGRKKCGASTITQQTVKTFFLDTEKTYSRKVREMVLAKRLEDALSKKDILYLYLNQIYFGHGAYGVQEAARVYFGKNVGELNLEEAALLAGLPQSPNGHDPYRRPDSALRRRAYVLGRMLELQMIDAATHAQAAGSELKLDEGLSDADVDSNNYYAAWVRTLLEQRFGAEGKEKVEKGGLEVHTGVDPALQRRAEAALQEGLRDVDKRQGWRGPLARLDPPTRKSTLESLELKRSGLASRLGNDQERVIWDLSRIEGQPNSNTEAQVLEFARYPRFRLKQIYGGIVLSVDDATKEALVDLGGVRVALPHKAALAWARPFDINKQTMGPAKPSQVLGEGDIVLVRALEPKKGDATIFVGILEQTPQVQGALVAIDATTREVRAMVGGYGLGAGTFNRAIQARRQAGSTFKPFVYAAAFETQKYTPISICLDQPKVYYDPWLNKAWKPQNYGRNFDGDITLRRALTLSKNICSVELIEKIGVEPVLDLAKRVGIQSELPKNLTAALGSGDVSPLEMVNAYATLATAGEYADPVFITKIVDGSKSEAFGKVPKQVIAAQITYLVTSLMQSVVEDGTAQQVKALARPVAGKTGTTNESRDAWFVGYTADLVVGVWVGFDNNASLGPKETGGRAAIPIWMDFMDFAMRDRPAQDFVAPGGITFASVDPTTGKLAPAGMPGAKLEPFLEGTEPREEAIDARPVDRGAWEDYER